MDHIVFMDAEANELENLIKGNKSMIIRGGANRVIPHDKVYEGDVLYLIESNGEEIIKARGIVSSVLNSEELSCEESFETIIRHQDKLQLSDKQFDRIAGRRYLVLIGLSRIEEIEPFLFDKNNFTGMDDWIPVGNIATVFPEIANIK